MKYSPYICKTIKKRIKTKTMTTITNIAYYYEGERGSNVRLMSMS